MHIDLDLTLKNPGGMSFYRIGPQTFSKMFCKKINIQDLNILLNKNIVDFLKFKKYCLFCVFCY